MSGTTGAPPSVPDVALSELKRYMTGGELAGLPVAAEISAQETRGRLPVAAGLA